MLSKDIAVSVRGLSKSYTIAHNAEKHTTMAEALTSRVRNPLQRVETETFWALKDIEFDIKKGDVVGIIGRNGAGKSTLLKILSQITEPTKGEIRLYGRVGSLLEVGTGFHPELTGRENIFLNGAILGMRKSEIQRQFNAIVSFAEVEHFLDTPVKRYSSGMYVRLAFAVAAHLNPEILVVDEVLAVGDAEFQKKCIGKMKEVAYEGRTILFVSHDIAAITSLTQTCILLKNGQVEVQGTTPNITTAYLSQFGMAGSYTGYETSSGKPYIRSVKVISSESQGVQAFGFPLTIEIEILHNKKVNGACLSLQIINQFQQPATHAWIYSSENAFCSNSGGTVLRCQIPKIHLNVGQYSLKIYFTEPPGGEIFETLENVCAFEVIRLNKTTLWGWRPEACVYHEDFLWHVSNS